MTEARITYNYAIIDETGWCYEQYSTSRNCDGRDGYIPITSMDIDYLDKYYNVENSLWYLDDAFTQLFEEGNV